MDDRGGRSVRMVVGFLVTACSASAPVPAAQPIDYPAGLRRILESPPAPTEDVFEVFVCDVPPTTTDPMYGDLELRSPLTPHGVATLMDDNVGPYFTALSHGLYSPHFVAGQALMMSATETHDQCVERALDSSADDSAAVMVVANAENVATAAGGWGRPGQPCAAEFCAASRTRRAIYVGASDFHPDWGPVPLLDLIEHEVGHTLGLPHSGAGTHGENQHASALDVMSNSAAPRELAGGEVLGVDAHPEPRHAQDTLAINRLALGWLTSDDMWVVAPSGGAFDLSSSAGSTGLRLLVLPIDAESFLTVEYFVAQGLLAFLPASGVAVHRIEQASAACARPVGDGRPCAGIDRAQITLGSAAPHLELLSVIGDRWVLDGWTITVTSVGRAAQVEVSRSER